MKNVVVVEGTNPDPRLIAALSQKVEVFTIRISAETFEFIDQDNFDLTNFVTKIIDVSTDITQEKLEAQVNGHLSIMKFESAQRSQLAWITDQKLSQIKLEIDRLKTLYNPERFYVFEENLPTGAKIPKKFLRENHRITKMRFKK